MRMKDTPAATPGQYTNNGITNTTSIVLILFIVFPKPCITWVMWRDNGTKNYRTLTEKPWLNAGNTQSLMEEQRDFPNWSGRLSGVGGGHE